MSRYPMVPLEDVLTPTSDEIAVAPDETYRPVGIYSFGRGLFEKPSLMGSETTYLKFHRLHAGQFVYSRLFAWEGAFAVVASSFSGRVVSQEFPTFRIDKELANPGYIGWICRWPAFWEEMKGQTRGLGLRRKRVHPDHLLRVRVPLPDLPEQGRLATWLDRNASYGDRALAISRHNLAAAEAAWWALLREEFERLAHKLTSLPLDEVVDVNPESVAPARDFGARTFRYVDISSVTNGTGKISEPKSCVGTEAPSRARRRIRAGDVLVSTVRPNLRGFAEVPEDLDGQVCSTGFAVLRPKAGVSSRFLLYQVLSDHFLDQLVASMRGGHYPAVNDSELRRARVVRPSSAVQTKTVNRFGELEPKLARVAALHRERVELLEALIPSLLNATLNEA